MRERLRTALTAAMKGKDRVATAALRSALAAIDNAEARAVDDVASAASGTAHVAGATAGVGSTEIARHELTEDQVVAIVRHEIAERARTAGEYDELGRSDEADRLRTEAAVLTEHLP